MDRAETLKNCELFKQLTDEQLLPIEKMCTEEMFQPGDIMCKQNEIEEKIYIIKEGMAGVCFELGPLSHLQVQSIGKLGVCGWSAMIEPFRCTATVKTIKKIKALSFKGKELYDYCSENPEVGLIITRSLTRIIGKRLREAFSQVVGIPCDI